MDYANIFQCCKSWQQRNMDTIVQRKKGLTTNSFSGCVPCDVYIQNDYKYSSAKDFILCSVALVHSHVQCRSLTHTGMYQWIS